MIPIRLALVGLVVAAGLVVAGCGDRNTYLTVPITTPTPTPTPAPAAPTRVEFRVVGNANAARVKYSTPLDGLTQVTTTLPYLTTFSTTSTSLFLSIDATALSYSSIVSPFLSVQILVGGVLFREATSTDFLLAPLTASGTWRQ